MPLKLILMSPDGTVGADGKARVDILRDLCTFIKRMAARDVQVAIWSFHRQLLDGEPLETYLTRESQGSGAALSCRQCSIPRATALWLS